MAAGSRADVDRPGSGYRAWVQGRYGRAKAVLRAVAEEGLQAAAESRGAAPGHGAAPWSPSSESRGDVEYEDSAQLERTMFPESGNTDVK